MTPAQHQLWRQRRTMTQELALLEEAIPLLDESQVRALWDRYPLAMGSLVQRLDRLAEHDTAARLQSWAPIDALAAAGLLK